MKKKGVEETINKKPAYTTFDTMDVLDIEKPRLMQWMRDGLLPKGKKVEFGSMKKTMFTFKEICLIAVFKLLLDRGVKKTPAAKIIKAIEKDWEKRPPSYLVVANGPDGLYHQVWEEKYIDFLLVKIAAIYVNFSELESELIWRIKNLKANKPFYDIGEKPRWTRKELEEFLIKDPPIK